MVTFDIWKINIPVMFPTYMEYDKTFEVTFVSFVFKSMEYVELGSCVIPPDNYSNVILLVVNILVGYNGFSHS